MTAFDAIVLAGGRSRRMGGADKLDMHVGDATLLDRVLDGARRAGASTIVAVGPQRPTNDRAIRWVMEDEPGVGPAQAIAAGASALESGEAPVVVLAGDLPFASHTSVIDRLLDALPGHDVALLVDRDGRDQYLVSVFTRDALPVTGTAGAPVRTLLAGLDVARVYATSDEESLDCDTPDDVERARRIIEN